MPSKVWGEITYQFPNFNGGTVEVWESISNCDGYKRSAVHHGNVATF